MIFENEEISLKFQNWAENKNLVIMEENWTKSAIKLSLKVPL